MLAFNMSSSSLSRLIVILLLLFVIIITIPGSHSLLENYIFKSDKLTFESIVAQKGFRLISYDVITSDGYYLTLHRIVRRKIKECSLNSRKPVLLGHCISGSSVNFFINSEIVKSPLSPYKCGNNLGFCLAIAGYDVWAINFRGNSFSLGSDGASIRNPSYWSFSLGKYSTFTL